MVVALVADTALNHHSLARSLHRCFVKQTYIMLILMCLQNIPSNVQGRIYEFFGGGGVLGRNSSWGCLGDFHISTDKQKKPLKVKGGV